jgi:hypothetical protein
MEAFADYWKISWEINGRILRFILFNRESNIQIVKLQKQNTYL